ncbi:hypothetical protein AbraIFM66951_006739 [Aspergillus brasiliensis]|nr:hypothetical protein AbraIFM66951_006739 [Aspergillus brasiliensis]
MPRPPTKRNRLTSKASSAVEKDNQQSSGRNSISSVAVTKSTGDADQAIVAFSEITHSGQASEIRRQLRNQTPLTRAQEHAIESSPIGEREATGSRPATRARGYSSTLSVAGRKGDAGSKVPGTPAFESSILSNFRRRPRQPSILQMMQAEDGSSDFDDDDDDEDNIFLGSLSPEDESTPLNLSRVQDSPGAFSQTLAPPMSSSPPLSPTHTTSPEMTQEKRIDKSAKSTASRKLVLPTAALQNRLLPRRNRSQRKRFVRDGSEIPEDPSDGGHSATQQDDDDDDELYYLPPKRSSRAQRKRSEEQKPARSTTRTVQRRQPIADSVEGQITGGRNPPTQPYVTARKSGEKKMTYRLGALDTMGLDKENEPVDTSPLSSPLSTPPESEASESESTAESNRGSHFLSDELRLQAKKFADVDKWKLEFEDVTPDSQGSEVFR